MYNSIKRFLIPIEQSYFLFGPRGTGKSTWLKLNYPNALRIDLLKPAEIRQYRAYPERLEEIVRAAKTKTIIIDEVQKLPELLFSRFLEVMSFSQGAILNLSNIARECELSRKLIEGYLDVLQDLLLSFQIPVFSIRAKRELISHPKFYYFDTGVYNNLRPSGYLDTVAELNGAGLEGLVAQHLRAWNDSQGEPNKLYYWRTRYGLEVDFIIDGKAGLFAIEVKNADKIHDKDLNGLKAFCEDYPEVAPLFLYRGKDRLQKNHILCLPVEEFLKELTPFSPIPWRFN